MAYFLPHVRWHESSFILHAGSMPVVGSSCLDKLVMNVHYFKKKKIQNSHITRFSHFTFSHLFIMNLKYFVTSRHHSGALISSMRQILNYLLGKFLKARLCFKQDKN